MTIETQISEGVGVVTLARPPVNALDVETVRDLTSALGAMDADPQVRVVILTGSGVARRGDGKMLRGPLARVFFEYMTKHRLEPLIRAGAETYEYATPKLEEIVTRGGVVRPYVHAKVMSVDGEVASVGSANLDVTASYWENEANVVIESAAVVRELEATIERLLATSYRIDLDSSYWRGEARMREITSTLWPETLYS